jgi:hypothetical protein
MRRRGRPPLSGLFVKLVFLGLVAMGVSVWVGMAGAGRADTARHAHCFDHKRTVQIHVPARVVEYARAQGWPRVLAEGGDGLLASPVDYDHSPEADLVRHRIRRLCEHDRYRLVSS